MPTVTINADGSIAVTLNAQDQGLALMLREERGMTVLMATHHPDDAEAIAGGMVFLEDGRVSASGPASEFFGEAAPAAFRRYVGNTPMAGLPRPD